MFLTIKKMLAVTKVLFFMIYKLKILFKILTTGIINLKHLYLTVMYECRMCNKLYVMKNIICRYL